VFLAGALDYESKSVAVRIRNLSENGALVEGDELPPLGENVHLARARNSVGGKLVWQANGQGGINFDFQIDVESWVRGIGHPGQQRVDKVAEAIRRSQPIPDELDRAATESLVEISSALDQTCERLAAMPKMSVQLGEELMKLDAIAITLRRLAAGRKH
jgi:hypothetical protein